MSPLFLYIGFITPLAHSFGMWPLSNTTLKVCVNKCLWFSENALIISLSIQSSPHAFPFFKHFTALLTSSSAIGEFKVSLSKYSLHTLPMIVINIKWNELIEIWAKQYLNQRLLLTIYTAHSFPRYLLSAQSWRTRINRTSGGTCNDSWFDRWRHLDIVYHLSLGLPRDLLIPLLLNFFTTLGIDSFSLRMTWTNHRSFFLLIIWTIQSKTKKYYWEILEKFRKTQWKNPSSNQGST